MGVMKTFAGGASKSGNLSFVGYSIRGSSKSVKAAFLDRQAVISRLDKMHLRNLRRFGSLTRSVARRSMRKGGKRAKFSEFDNQLKQIVSSSGMTPDKINIEPWPIVGSLPGRPPKTRTRRLKDNVYFVANPKSRSVIIGPQVSGRDDIPGLLEFGGTPRDRTKTWVSFWSNGQRLIRLAEKGRPPIRLKARPYMRPAYETALDKLVPQMYRNQF